MYPIYNVHAVWNQSDYPGNATGFDIMYRANPGPDAVHDEARRWWEKYSCDQLAHKNPEILSLEVIRKPDDDWCLTWFSHYTFDVGQSDEEVLASFAAYVRRIQSYNAKHVKWYESENGGWWSEPICLMGAEEQRRWKSPCRCEHCQKRGVVSINH